MLFHSRKRSGRLRSDKKPLSHPTAHPNVSVYARKPIGQCAPAVRGGGQDAGGRDQRDGPVGGKPERAEGIGHIFVYAGVGHEPAADAIEHRCGDWNENGELIIMIWNSCHKNLNLFWLHVHSRFFWLSNVIMNQININPKNFVLAFQQYKIYFIKL